ncbi:MAG: acyltransferase [Desulfobacteraceae bacterium]|nr:MAG: acyltransferase [Desulfobacteraceae bacterium]
MIAELIQNYRKVLLKFKVGKCGKNLKVFGKVKINGGEHIEIGDNCRLNEGVYLLGAGKIIIKDFVTLSPYSKIITASYDTSAWGKKENFKKEHIKHVKKSVFIQESTWIGTSAIILPGVQLTGKGIIVAAGSVVTKSINDDFVLVGGNPAHIIKRFV